MSPLRSVTEHIRLQQRTEKQQLLRVPFCLSVSKICRGCHNKIKRNLFCLYIVMDSACGRRGSVVNAMSSHLFLLDFLKVRFCLPCEQRLHLRRRCRLACKSSYFSHASSHRENVLLVWLGNVSGEKTGDLGLYINSLENMYFSITFQVFNDYCLWNTAIRP